MKLFEEAVFCNGGNIEDEILESSETHIELGEEAPKDVEIKVSSRTEKVNDKWVSRAGVQILKTSVERHKSLFRIIFGSGRPTNVPPLDITLDDTNRPVKVKARR